MVLIRKLQISSRYIRSSATQHSASFPIEQYLSSAQFRNRRERHNVIEVILLSSIPLLLYQHRLYQDASFPLRVLPGHASAFIPPSTDQCQPGVYAEKKLVQHLPPSVDGWTSASSTTLVSASVPSVSSSRRFAEHSPLLRKKMWSEIHIGGYGNNENQCRFHFFSSLFLTSVVFIYFGLNYFNPSPTLHHELVSSSTPVSSSASVSASTAAAYERMPLCCFLQRSVLLQSRL